METAACFPSGESANDSNCWASLFASICVPDRSSHTSVLFSLKSPLRYNNTPFSDAENAAKPTVPASPTSCATGTAAPAARSVPASNGSAMAVVSRKNSTAPVRAPAVGGTYMAWD